MRTPPQSEQRFTHKAWVKRNPLCSWCRQRYYYIYDKTSMNVVLLLNDPKVAKNNLIQNCNALF